MTASGTPRSGERSALQVFTILLRRRRTVALVPALAVLLVLATGLPQRRSYTVITSFIPQAASSSRLGSLSGLAAQFGLANLTEGTSLASPEFYRQLLSTREILGQLADTPLDSLAHGLGPGTIADYWLIEDPNPARRRELTIIRLRKTLVVEVDPRTQLVSVSVKTNVADLSAGLARTALSLMSTFNRERRQSQSADEAKFVGARLHEVEQNLRAAEDAEARFMEQNRDFAHAPALNFQYQRLERDVALRQTLYTTLSQAYEQSRIDEVRDTPVITVVETARPPAIPDSRRLALKATIALLAGTLLGGFIALAQELMAHGASGGATDRADFDHEVAELRKDLRRPWRLLRAAPVHEPSV